MKAPSILMTDPRYFAIRGGANPHTRNANNTLKSVNITDAQSQWDRYIDQLEDCGVNVHIIDSGPELTGMVFAANAGFFNDRNSESRVFYPSNFTAAHRQAESKEFSSFMKKLGFAVGSLSEDLRFEGEADAFPIDDEHTKYVFTHGFRSDAEVGEWVKGFRGNVEFFELQDPRFYHGDCLICSLGDSVLGWEPGLEKGAKERLEKLSDVIWITDLDAMSFIGNSFYLKNGSERFLFSPDAIRDSLKDEIEERGITVIPVNISEFFSKGGGGPKCMVFNLDKLPATTNPDVKDFRASRRVNNWRAGNPIK